MPHPNHVGDSKPCICSNCPYKPKSKDKLLYGSKIDKLYYDKYLPLRERKLCEKLVRTRAIYDDIRTRIISSSSEDDDNRLTDRESQAINEFIGLVDRGELPSLNSSVSLHSSCCSCCRCQAKHAQIAQQKVHMHVPSVDTVNNYLTKQKIKKRKRKFISDSCLCTLKLSLIKNRRTSENKHFESIMRARKKFKSHICKCSNKLRYSRKLKKLNSSISFKSNKLRRSRNSSNDRQRFDGKKDSLVIHKERMKKKWECEPGFCIPNDCVPKDCYKEILKRDLPDLNRGRVVKFKDEYSQTIVDSGQNKRIVTEREKRMHVDQQTRAEDFISTQKEKHQTQTQKVNKKIRRPTKAENVKKKISMCFCECKRLVKPASSMTDISMAKTSSTNLMSSQTVSAASWNKTKQRQRKKRLPFPRKCAHFMCKPGHCNLLESAAIQLKNAQGTHEFEPCFCTIDFKKNKKEKKNNETKMISKASVSESQKETENNESTVLKEKKKFQKTKINPSKLTSSGNQTEKEKLLAAKIKAKENQIKERKSRKPKVIVSCECLKSTYSMTELQKDKTSATNIAVTKTKSTMTRDMRKQQKTLPFPRECDPYMCKPRECDPHQCSEMLLKKQPDAKKLDRCFCTLNLKKLQKHENKTSSSESQTDIEEIATDKKKEIPKKKPTIKTSPKILPSEQKATVFQENKMLKKEPKPKKLKSMASMTELRKDKANVTNTAVTKTETTLMPDYGKGVKSLSFPRECDPYMCEPGKCNPQKCAEILLERSKIINHPDRCFCTLEFNKRSRKEKNAKTNFEGSKSSLIEDKMVKTAPKISAPRSQTEIENVGAKQYKQKKVQKKDITSRELKITCECKKAASSNTELLRNKTSYTNTITTRTKSTKPRKIKGGTKSLPFPRECDPFMCVPGECDPKKCAEILMQNSQRENQSDRCFCTLKYKKKRTHKTIKANDKNSKFLSLDKTQTNRSSSTMSHQRKTQSSATNAPTYRNQYTVSTEKPKGRILFPRECDPYMCIPGKCDPKECSAILLKNSDTTLKRCFCTLQSTGNPKQKPNITKIKKVQKNEPKVQKVTGEYGLHIKTTTVAATQPEKIKLSTKDTTPRAKKFEAVQKDLERCFCTLKFQPELLKERKQRKIIAKQLQKDTTVNTTPSQSKENGNLSPSECERLICIPGKCDPLVCEEIVKTRGTKNMYTDKGTDAPKKVKIISASETKSPKNVQTRKVKSRNPLSKANKEKKPYPPRSRSSTNVPGRQVVRISSSFTFDIEFFKEKNYPDTNEPNHSTLDRPGKKVGINDSNVVVQNERRLKEKKAKATKDKHRKEGNSKVKIIEKSQQTKSTETKIVSQDLIPYECEPGNCVPGKCDPKLCQEIIRKRNLLERCFCTLGLKKNRTASKKTG